MSPILLGEVRQICVTQPLGGALRHGKQDGGAGWGALQGQGLLVDVRTVPVGETRGFWDGWASCLHDGVITLAAAVRCTQRR